ncbi:MULTISPECIES: GNAT family N-acetyltransferase [Pseudomonas]|uniref:GNAT family N-acetyltransferase n=1 Tax=Pseudomonas TaxID=286 RepID=UPI0020C21DB4|nr:MULTISPECIES: GNAT family N-acetyltransferase [Pseudomonas]MDH1575453.1 GNAT family N-acetyltransferase [Pseudomonas sp. GD03746]UTL83250.1 GNAT family N-acetyltransferase [Pseudomonas putida]HEN8710572.1 GNAT family N-acetyltransferase [Pseudomonas putida]HEN8714945.1 GNAT family N-acetyltransferase [Pseudomonas putida]
MLPIELLTTTPDQADLIRNLYQFYAYESSDWEQEDVEVNGRFYIHEEHLQRYWLAEGWSANLVLVDGFIAGFVLVERSELPGINASELADLFILKRYRRQGIGRAVALQVLTGAGDWLLRCYAPDPAAVAFCKAVVAELPRPVQQIVLGDDPDLLTYKVTSAYH